MQVLPKRTEDVIFAGGRGLIVTPVGHKSNTCKRL